MQLKNLKVSKLFTSIWFLVAICFLLNLATFLFLYFQLHPGEKQLALHYNVLVGVEWYGKGKNLYLIPAIGFIISFINFVLYRALKKSADFFAPLALFINITVQIILLAAVIFLARVN